MKTKLLFMVFALSVALVSCDKKSGGGDGEGTGSDHPLVGTWKSTFGSISGETNLEYEELVVNAGGTGKLKVVFRNGATDNYSFSWTTSGDKVMVDVKDVGTMSLFYSVSGKKLTLADEYGDVIAEFEKQGEDPPPPPPPDDHPLLGTWVEEGYDYVEKFTFNDKGNGSYYWWDDESGETTVPFTWTATAKEITLKAQGMGDWILGYSISGNTLTLYEDGEVYGIYTKEGNNPPPPPPPPPGDKAEVRFKKEKAYENCIFMGIAQGNDIIAYHDLGIDAGTSPYYQISEGNHMPIFSKDGQEWYYSEGLESYNFKAGRKYTYVCSDDGTYLTFYITDDGVISKSSGKGFAKEKVIIPQTQILKNPITPLNNKIKAVVK